MFTFKRLNRVTIAVILAALAVPIVYAADTSTAPSTTLSISSAIAPEYEVIHNAGDENDDDDDDFCMLIFFGLQVKATIIIPVTTEKIQITLVSYQEPIILGF